MDTKQINRRAPLTTAYARSDNRLWAWWRDRSIATVEHERVLTRVGEEARWSSRYAFLVVISAWISILGLLLPSSAVLIGAMLLSPLMMPIIGLGFALATLDFVEMRRASFALAAGSMIAILLSAGFVAISPVQTVTSEIASRTRPNLFDLLVALLSAVAGAYALIRGRGETVVGVAIAIALMPPLAVVGFGIATSNWTVSGGALLLFFTNLITMAFTAALVARLYGFGAHLTPKHTRLQSLLLLAGIIALAVPLGLTLRQIAWQSVASRQIREGITRQFPGHVRLSELETDFHDTPIRVVATVLTPNPVPRAAEAAAAQLTQTLARPIHIDLDQVRVDTESGVENAQLAAAQDGERNQAIDRLTDRMGDRLALVAGVPRDAVLIDRTNRRAVANAAELPGAGLALYRRLEQRASVGLDGWSLALIPPLVPLPAVSFGEDGPDADGQAAIGLAAWAATRRNVAIGVTGSDERAAAVEQALAALGARTVRADSAPAGADVTLSWALPGGD